MQYEEPILWLDPSRFRSQKWTTLLLPGYLERFNFVFYIYIQEPTQDIKRQKDEGEAMCWGPQMRNANENSASAK